MLEGTHIPWTIALIGGAAPDHALTRTALERGGHVRIGLEDDADGDANVEMVERAVKLCEAVGRPVATLPETEAILGLH